MGVNKLYDLMWMLLYAEKISRKCANALNKLLPSDIPIVDQIVIPYYEPPDAICDYVLQTANTLIDKRQKVYLLHFYKPVWFLAYFLCRYGNIIGRFERLNPKVSIIPAITLFPKPINNTYLRILDNFFSFTMAAFMIKKLDQPIIWCFHHQDSHFLRFIKKEYKVIYDIVDYFFAVDAKDQTKMEINEKNLIARADKIFVNSRALLGIKQKLTDKKIIVVPLGFDMKSFQNDCINHRKANRAEDRLFRTIKGLKVGYIGNFQTRVDFRLLNEVVGKMPKVNFIFTEAFVPEDSDHADIIVSMKRLSAFKNVFFFPRTTDRKIICRLIKRFDICIIPYQEKLKCNRYCFPMKFMEYFYMGKPVISTPILELYRYRNLIYIGRTAKEWINRINYLVKKPWPEINSKKEKEIARQNSWDQKISTILMDIRTI
jgi:glycosyltransferase involved in cell wall biosynthesis